MSYSFIKYFFLAKRFSFFSVFTFTLLLSSICLPIDVFAVPTIPTIDYLDSVMTTPQATRVTVDGEGNIYVSDTKECSVVKYNLFGERLMTIKGFLKPLGVAVDESGNIYIGDDILNNISVYDPSGKFLRKLGSGDGEISMPNDIDIDPASGNIFAADSDNNSVKVYGPSGDFLYELTGFTFPTGIFIDSQQAELYVGDYFNCIIKVYDLAGNFQRSFGTRGMGSGQLYAIQGITMDDAGRVYVIDSFNAVQVFDSTGIFLENIGGSEPGILKLPMDGIVDLYNRLIVTSMNNGSIKYFGIDGTQLPADADRDGLPDDWEMTYFGHHKESGEGDPDGDGLTNLEEYLNGTNPTVYDTDGDGIPDGWEVARGLNPLVNDGADDSDGNGYTNYEEYLQWLDEEQSQHSDVSTIVYVDDDNRLGPWLGTEANPYREIQTALTIVDSGTVRVATGLYQENIIVTSPKLVKMEGGWDSNFTSRSGDPSETMIDGNKSGNVIYFSPSGGESNFTVEGFMLTNGQSAKGGGLYLQSSGAAKIMLNIMNSVITGNSAISGGGISLTSTTLSDTVTVVMKNTIISNNIASESGGGIYLSSSNMSSTNLNMINSTVSGNMAIGNSVSVKGGGLFVYSESGGSSIVTLLNDIVWGNSLDEGEEDIHILQYSGVATVNASYSNMGVVDNSSGSYNDITGNLNLDPIFVDSPNGDYHLFSTSPLIDKGGEVDDPTFDFDGDPRIWGPAVDMGAEEYIGIVSIALKKGWNLISLPVQPFNTDIEAVLSSINGKYNIVWGFDSFSGEQGWLNYRSGARNNSLNVLEAGRGYWILMKEEAVLDISGNAPVDLSIMLYEGWNLIGIPGLTDKSVEETLSSLLDSKGNPLWTVIWGNDDRWKGRTPDQTGKVSDLNLFEAGRGYWIEIVNDVEWTP